MKNRFILVGAKPSYDNSQHPGGVLTLSIGLMDYAKSNGYEIEIIDTYRSGFEKKPLNVNIRQGIIRVIRLYRLLRSDSYSGVIIFSGAGVGFFERSLMSIVCKLFKVPDLFVIVDGWFLQIKSSGYFKYRLIKILLRVPYKLVASGQRWVDFFIGMGVDTSRIIPVNYWLPQSFTVEAEVKKIPEKGVVKFIFIGWMIKEKGVEEILESIKSLSGKYKFSFTFIGGGTLLEYVRQKIRVEKWENFVFALGWVDSQIFEQAITGADIFVLPSYAEGFPMSLIEAMSKGLPSICSNVGGISDSLIDGVNGYLISPRNSSSLCSKMEKYLQDPSLIPFHSASTLQIVKKNHDIQKNCRLYFESLRKE